MSACGAGVFLMKESQGTRAPPDSLNKVTDGLACSTNGRVLQPRDALTSEIRLSSPLHSLPDINYKAA